MPTTFELFLLLFALHLFLCVLALLTSCTQ